MPITDPAARTNSVPFRASLRSAFTLSFGALTGMAVIATSALLVVSIVLHRNTHELTAAAIRDEIARDVEADLLLHSQLSTLALAEPKRSDVADLEVRQKRNIRDHLDEAYAVTGEPAERSLVVDLATSVNHYFQVRDQVQADALPLPDALTRTAAALDLALRDDKNLQALTKRDIDAMTGYANLVHHDFIALAIVVAAAVVFGAFGVALAMRSLIYRPLSALRDAIRNFSTGITSTRAEECIPLELSEVARTFNEMASTIVRQREDQLASLAGIAHDLNNPIAVLRVLTDPRAAKHAVKSEERIQRTLALVNHQVLHLHRMVGDLLDTARIESGQLHLELAEHDLREVTRKPVELYRELSSTHEVRLTVPDEPVIVRCDAERFEQALDNLIENAIKYSPQGGPVLVTVSSDDASASVSISDEGVGIGPEQLSEIFEPFRRSGPPGIPGAGLGLSLVKRIVEAHGGAVDVHSVPRAGSTFRIRLPLVRRPARPPAIGAPDANADHGRAAQP